MEKLKVEDIKQHIIQQKKDSSEIELDNDFSSYIFCSKDKYWLVSRLSEFDSIFNEENQSTGLLEVLKFVFGTAVECNDFVAIDKEGYLISQRLIKQDNPTDISEHLIKEAISEHEDYSTYLLHLLQENKNDSKITRGGKLKVFMP